MTATDDYTKQAHLSASLERVFETLSTPAEFASWWAPAGQRPEADRADAAMGDPAGLQTARS